MFKQNNKTVITTLMVPIISIIMGFVLGALVMLFFGYNPWLAYDAMITTVITSPYFFGEALRQATILTLTGLGFTIAYQAGFFNIGLPGQMLLGWLSTIWVALAFPDWPRLLLVSASILVGLLVGALYSSIAGFLRAYFGTNEVIVTIMLNYIALHLTNYLIRTHLATGNTTDSIGPNASIHFEWLTNLTSGSRLNLGIFIVLVVVVLFWFYMNKTTSGFEIRAVGLNKDAAQYAGMSAKKNIILSMFLSGALAGLAGAIQGLGTFGNIFTQTSLPSEGFNGMAVALLGLGNPLGTFLASILFGILNVGSAFMPQQAGVPDELASVIIAAIIFFVGSNFAIRWALRKLMGTNKKENKGDQVV